MSGPASVLNQPGTEYGRTMSGTMSAPWASGMTNNSSPFGANGVGNPMADALPGLGGTSSYNPARGPTLGAYDRINFQLNADFANFESHRTGTKQITFVSRHPNGASYDMRGLSMMNQYLSSKAGVEKYGGKHTTYELLNDWALYGVPVSLSPESTSGTSDRCETMTIAKLIRVVNPCTTIANRDRSGKPTLSIGDHIYLLFRRFPKSDKIAEIFGNAAHQVNQSRAASSSPPTEKFYWRIDSYASRDKVPPSPRLYNSTSGKGVALFVGSVYTVYGQTNVCAEAIDASREAFHPTDDTASYIRNLNLGYEIDLQFGVK